MEHIRKRNTSVSHHHRRSNLSKLIWRDDSGVTLIELLASLVIGSAILSVVAYTGNYEYQSWNQVTSQSNLHSDVRDVDERLQNLFQNLTGVKLDTNYATQTVQWNGTNVLSGIAVEGTDAEGETVEVMLQPSTNSSSNADQAVSQFVVTYTPAGGTTPTKTTVLPSPFSSFTGSWFITSGPLVIANLNATYQNALKKPLVYQLNVTYVTEGGY